MAPAHVASAFTNTDSIKGLAQSIAKPAYRRLLGAETVLRRAVPVLIVTFLVTVAIGAGLQVHDNRRQVIAAVVTELDLLAGQLAERINLAAREQRADVDLRHIQDSLAAFAGRAPFKQRDIVVSDASGLILAASSARTGAGRQLMEIIGPDHLFVTFAKRANAREILLVDGTEAFATVHPLRTPLGHLAVIEPSARALARWRSDTTLTVTLSATTGFVALILGFAFHWQSARAREADLIHDTVRRRIDTALNRGRCGLWDWDLASGRIFWSQSMFAILGLEARDDLLAFGDVNKLVHPQDADLYALAAELADGNAQSIDRAFRMRHARGHWVWLRVRCEIIRQPDAGGPHLIGIAVDITEQKSLVERTMAADLRLRDAIETIPEAFVLWDAENRLVLCNSNFQELHNLSDDATAAGTSYEAVLAAGRQHVARTIVNERGSAMLGARTFEAQLDDGRWLQISERRTKDGGYVSVGTDITAIKRHEAQLVESERRLMATIADLRASQHALRTQARELAELAEKYSAEKTRAEDANQAKSKFLANMSHELRTPLNAIIGFSEIMEAQLFGPLGVDRYDEYCRDIRESGQYLLEVINDILDMSRIEAGRLRLDFEDVEVDRILGEALRVVAKRAEDKALTVNARIAPGLVLTADRRALKQVLLNLLSNAVKFTDEGGEVRVHARNTGRSVVIAIADTGIGIAREALAKLCRPFEQVEDHFTKSHQGSGLGLAISKSLVELHRGTMRIRSTPNKGTIVLLRLPTKERVPPPIDYKWGSSVHLRTTEKSTLRH
ncbi:MAG: PAS domain-containing sensor histidine kinase [Rhodoplanes sp.]